MRNVTFILLITFLLGCSGNEALDATDEIEFGFKYQIISDSNLPSLSNGKLIAKVGYSGCSGNHEFIFKYRISNAAAELWLFKETRDQDCLAAFGEVKTYALPQNVLSSKNIFLVTPNEERLSLK
ncbi:MAG: hypothetical protein WD597_10085 [Balneolaceae bacterium]